MLRKLRQAIRNHRRTELEKDGFRSAAVLLPLFVHSGQVHFLMERRSQKVDHHKGQISFPGGACEAQDPDAVATALREAQEEVGLNPEDVEVIGLLDDRVTVSRFRVTPVVGIVPDAYDYTPNTGEVAELLQVPWSLFSNPKDFEPCILEHAGVVFHSRAYLFQGHYIWGATARITRQLVELVEGGTMS
jgi:8-oxo-dGTP pyrophosphatase MutT (NUDIX family)